MTSQKEIIVVLDDVLHRLVERIKKEQLECVSKLATAQGLRTLDPAKKEYWRGLNATIGMTKELLKVCWLTHQRTLQTVEPEPSKAAQKHISN